MEVLLSGAIGDVVETDPCGRFIPVDFSRPWASGGEAIEGGETGSERSQDKDDGVKWRGLSIGVGGTGSRTCDGLCETVMGRCREKVCDRGERGGERADRTRPS